MQQQKEYKIFNNCKVVNYVIRVLRKQRQRPEEAFNYGNINYILECIKNKFMQKVITQTKKIVHAVQIESFSLILFDLQYNQNIVGFSEYFQEIYQINELNKQNIDDQKQCTVLPFNIEFILSLFSSFQISSGLYQKITGNFLFTFTPISEFGCKDIDHGQSYYPSIIQSLQQNQNLVELKNMIQQLNKNFQQQFNNLSFSFLRHKLQLSEKSRPDIVKTLRSIRYYKDHHQIFSKKNRFFVNSTFRIIEKQLKYIIEELIQKQDVKTMKNILILFTGNIFSFDNLNYRIKSLQDILDKDFDQDFDKIFTIQNQDHQIQQHNSIKSDCSNDVELLNQKTKEFYESDIFQLFLNQQQYGYQQENFFNGMKKYLQQNSIESSLLQISINNVIDVHSQKLREDNEKKYQIFSLLLLVNNLSNMYYFLLTNNLPKNEKYDEIQYLKKWSHFLSCEDKDQKITNYDIGFQLLISCINSINNNIIFFHEIMQEEGNDYLYFLSDSFQNKFSGMVKINQINPCIKLMMKLFLSFENMKQFEVYTYMFFQKNALKIKNKIYDEEIISQIFNDIKKIIFDVLLIDMFENIIKQNIRSQFIDIIARNLKEYLSEIKNVQILQIYQHYEQSSYCGDNLQKQKYSIKLFKQIKKILQYELIKSEHWLYENLTKEKRITLIEKFISEIVEIRLEQEQFQIIEQILLEQQEIFLTQFSNYNKQFLQHLQFLTKKLCYDIEQDQKQFQQLYTQMFKKLIKREDIKQNSLIALQNMKDDHNFSQNCTYYYQLIVCLFWPEQVEIDDLNVALSQIINIMENFYYYSYIIGSDCHEKQLAVLKEKLQMLFFTNGIKNQFLFKEYSQTFELILLRNYVIYYSPELSRTTDVKDQIQESEIKIRIKQIETEIFLNEQLIFLYENMQQYSSIFQLMNQNEITHHQFIKIILNNKENKLVSIIAQNVKHSEYEDNYSQIMNYIIILHNFLKNSDTQHQEFHKQLKDKLQEIWRDQITNFENLINYIFFESVYGMDEIEEDEEDIFYEPQEIQELLGRQNHEFLTMVQDAEQLKAKRKLRLSLILHSYQIQQEEKSIFDTFIRNECIIDSQFYQILQSISINRYRNINSDNSKIYSHKVKVQGEKYILEGFKKQWCKDISLILEQNKRNILQFAKNYFAYISIKGKKVSDQGGRQSLFFERAFQRKHIISYSFLEYKFWLQKPAEQNIVKVLTNINYSEILHPQQQPDSDLNRLVTETHKRVKQILENIIQRYIKNQDMKSLLNLIFLFCGSSFCDKKLSVQFTYSEQNQSQIQFITCFNLLYIGYNYCNFEHMKNFLIIEKGKDANEQQIIQQLNDADENQIQQLQERIIIEAFEGVRGKFTTI
ncbi:hypothetical protein ABPG72_018389 [Tetrahymena utriculariae]